MYEKSTNINERGGIDFEALEAGAARNAELRAENQRQIRDRELARQKAKQTKVDALMNKFAEQVKAEQKAKADAAIAEETAKAEAEIKAKQNKLNNVKEETAIDKAFRSLLKGND